MKNWKEILSNYPYLIWVVFYATLFWLIFGANAQSFWYVFIIYLSCMILSLTPFAEWIWQKVMRVRPPSTQKEKDKAIPLFEEVYEEAQKQNPNIFKNIQLYIQDDMDINAFAFGQRTLILTRGTVERLDDDSIKGFLAHEFGHFSHYDTVALLFAHVSNLLMGLFMRIIYWFANMLHFIGSRSSNGEDAAWAVRVVYKTIMGVYNFIVFIGDLILMSVSRKHEFLADRFAYKCGYGENLVSALYLVRQQDLKKPPNFMERLLSTHPPLVKRIEKLENMEE